MTQHIKEGLHCYGVRIGVDIVVFLRHAEQYLILQISVFIRDGIEKIYIGIGRVPLVCAGVGFDDAQMALCVPRSVVCGVSEHEACQFVFLQFGLIIQKGHQRRVILPKGLVAEVKVPADKKGQGVGEHFRGIFGDGGVLLRQGNNLNILLVGRRVLRRGDLLRPEGSGQADGQHRANRRQRRRGDLPGPGGIRRPVCGRQLRIDFRPGLRWDVQNFREPVQLLPGGPGQIGLPFADGLT